MSNTKEFKKPGKNQKNQGFQKRYKSYQNDEFVEIVQTDCHINDIKNWFETTPKSSIL